MWETDHSVETDASAADVWRLYSDTGTWPSWNAGVDRLELDGPFVTGTTGRLTPAGQEPVPFRVVRATPDREYVSETEIADTVTLRMTSVLTPLPGERTRIAHRAEFVGPGAEFFAQSFGHVFADGIVKTLGSLAQRAQQSGATR